MNKILLAGIALVAVASGPAFAADLPVRRAPPVYTPPPIVTYFSWTGCYIGGHAGGVWVQKDWTDNDPLSATFGQSLGSHDANGWLAGGQVGCNYQVGGWVFGIQGDYAWTDASGSSALIGVAGGTISSNVKGLASATGRVGYAWDRFLGYVKGGGAWEKDEYSRVRARFHRDG